MCNLIGYWLAQHDDEYPWMSCNSFEATRKNCPRGEACLKLKQFASYAWSWAMKCKFRVELFYVKIYFIFTVGNYLLAPYLLAYIVFGTIIVSGQSREEHIAKYDYSINSLKK